MKKILIGLSVLIVAALAGYALYFDETPAPNAAFTTLNGQKLDIASLKGHVVLVNFWATSCSGCVEEMPQIKQMHQAYAAKGLSIVAIAMSYDPPDYVKAFVSKNQLPFMVALDSSGDIAKAFGDIQLAPTTFLIDRQGKIVKRYVGVMDFKEVRRLIEEDTRS